ncbi:MAG: DUF559 domain-containing protein [Ilumatobacteraceae bacterium]
MDQRYRWALATAGKQFGALSTQQLEASGADRHVRARWARHGLIERVGTSSYAVVGSSPTWQRAAWAAAADVDGAGFLAGRTAARLLGLDGFVSNEPEVLVVRAHRGLRTPFMLRSTGLPLGLQDTVIVDGIRCLSAERLILDSPLFGFTQEETENAIDSSIRLRKVSEQRLRTRVVARHRTGINGSRQLLDALVDTGGESRLERWFLGIVGRAGIPRPELQRVVRDGQRTVARLDAFFPGNLVVEIAGHGTHSSRRQRQHDEQRRTELTLRGFRVITFTYDDVRNRPAWVIARLSEALEMAA